MRGVRKVFVAWGDSKAMCDALGVSLSWLCNAANNEGKLKGLNVYSYSTDKRAELDDDELAALAVDTISDKARERLRALIKRSGV